MAQKLALLGDSMIATGLDTANLRTLNRWISGPLVSLLGPSFLDYYNHGVGGDTIADCLDRVDNIEADADYVLVECGINDLSRPETTLDSMTDAYENIIRALRVAGKKIICCTVLERKRIEQGGAVADAQYAIRGQFNSWLRRVSYSGAIDGLVDFERSVPHGPGYRAVRDADDGTHPNTDMCLAIARVVASEVRRVVIASGDSIRTLGPNLLFTPQLMGNEGTSASAHISGDIATGWRFLDVQTGTEEIHCETVLDTSGGSQRLTFSGTPSGASVSDFLRDNQSSVDLTTGQTVMTGFRLRTENISGLIGVYSQLSLPLTGGTQYLSAMYAGPNEADTSYRQIEPSGDHIFWSPPYTAPEDLTGCEFRIALAYLDGAELSGAAVISDPGAYVLS